MSIEAAKSLITRAPDREYVMHSPGEVVGEESDVWTVTVEGA